MATILDTLRGLVTPELLAQASALLGESQGNVARGLGAAFPAILGGVMAKASDPSVMRQIMDLLTDRGVDSTMMRNATALLGSDGLTQSPITDLRSRFLSAVFGSQTGAVAGALASHAGLKTSSASTLLGLAAPIVMSVLGDRIRRDGLNAAGLTNLLSSQRDALLQDAPAGLASLLGLGAAPRLPFGDAYQMPARRSSSWLGWAAAAVLVAGGLWALLRARPLEQAQVPVEPPKQMASASPTDLPDPGTYTMKLPSNFEIKAPATGIEKQVVIFIQDNGKGVEDATWFDFDRLLFETGSSRLKPESREQLRNVAEILKAYPKVKVKVGGYTDNVGNPDANLKLSQDRATTVTNELVDLGVAPDRLAAEGYGEQHPVADNASEAGRQRNRRIALRVTEK